MAVQEKQEFDIPEGRASETILMVAEQGNIDVMFITDLVDDVRTVAVRGYYTPEKALKRLLKGSPLKLVSDPETYSFAVMRRKEKGNSASVESTHNPKLEQNMNKKKRTGPNRLFRLTSLFLASFVPAVNAQEPQEEEDEIQTLSPFDVSEEGNVGYFSATTLAGTRVETSLDDIGSSITIVNEEFLEDTNSTNLADVLVFTPNTEVGGLNGNFSASQGFGAGNPLPRLGRDENQQGGVTRIRGLAEADLTRNYFLTDIPFDTYNVQRIAVQRGANAALFGLGSPGGIVNHTLRGADFKRNRGRVKFTLDEFGAARSEFRVNQILMEDRLAIFLAGLHNDEKFEQEEASMRDRRIYGSIRFKANENISFFGNMEFGERNGSPGDPFPVNDGITPWLQSGSPTFDGGVDSANFFRGDFRGNRGLDYYTTIANGVGRGFVSFYQDVNSPDSTFGGNVVLNSGHTPPGTQNDPGVNPEWRLLQPRTVEDIIRRTGAYPDGSPVPQGSAGFFAGGTANQQILDRSIFDYREHLFSGGSSQQRSKWDALQIGAEGSWWDGRLGLEVSYFSQDWVTNTNNFAQRRNRRTLFIDPNRYLIASQDGNADGSVTFDGSGMNLVPNPSFGQPVIGGVRTGNLLPSDRDTVRATAFAEIRATDFMEENLMSKILGRARISFNSQRRDIENAENFGREKVDPFTVANNTLENNDIFNLPGSNFFRAGSMFTLPHGGGDFLNASSISAFQGANIGAVPFGMQRTRTPRSSVYTAFDEETLTFNEFEAASFTMQDNSATPASFFSSKNKIRIKSQVAVWQQYLWDNKIVLTGTWRSDKQETASIGAPSRSDIPGGLENTLDPAFVRGPVGLVTNVDDQSRSWSVVIHSPDFINERLPWGTRFSVYKSDSSNFQPSGDRVNVFNEQIEPVTGATIEQGFTIKTFNDKLIIRANWYETGVLNQSFDVGGISSSEGILLNLARQLDNPENVDQGFTASDVQAVLPPQGVIDVNGFSPDFANAEATTNRKSSDNGSQDFTSEGNEIEITYNPNARWTHLLSIARQQTVTSNTYPALGRYVNDFVRPVWIESDFAQNYFITDDATQTLAQAAQERIVQPMIEGQAQDGIPQIEQREWRVNYNTSYNFGKDSSLIPGFLGNLTVGGSMRWQDEVGIGFGVALNPDTGNYGPDPDQPYFGDSQMFIDLFVRSEWDLGDNRFLTAQINIDDALDHSDDLVPVFANPDNSRIYRFVEGRVLSASLAFEW